MSKLTNKQIDTAKQILKEHNEKVVYVVIDGAHMYFDKTNALAGRKEEEIEAVYASEDAKVDVEEEAKLAEQKKAEQEATEKAAAEAEAKAQEEDAARLKAIEEENAQKRAEQEAAEKTAAEATSKKKGKK